MVLYLAIFHKNKDNQYEVKFPDLKSNAATYGDSLEKAMQNAHDSLAGYLLTLQDYSEPIPRPNANPSSLNIKSPNLVVPIQVNLKLEREKEQNTLIKKTITIPSYLNRIGKKQKIDFSSVLTEALKDILKEETQI